MTPEGVGRPENHAQDAVSDASLAGIDTDVALACACGLAGGSRERAVWMLPGCCLTH